MTATAVAAIALIAVVAAAWLLIAWLLHRGTGETTAEQPAPLPRRQLPRHLRHLADMPGHPEHIGNLPGYEDDWNDLVVQLAVEIYTDGMP
jgi:hypothetical protein